MNNIVKVECMTGCGGTDYQVKADSDCTAIEEKDGWFVIKKGEEIVAKVNTRYVVQVYYNESPEGFRIRT